MRIAILSPGAIGGLLAGLLSKDNHEIFCVTSRETQKIIDQEGIRVISPIFGDFITYPEATSKLDFSIDIIIVTTKFPYLKEALTRIDRSKIKDPAVLSLLNGIGNKSIITEALGNKFITGTIGSIEANKSHDGIIQQLSNQKPHVEIAADSMVPPSFINNLAKIITNTGISISILDSENEVIWSKLVRLGAIASATAAFQLNIGAVRSDHTMRKVMVEMVQEGVTLARHEGVNIRTKNVIEQIDLLPSSLTTSLQRDIESNTISEIDSITGGILLVAETYDIPVPNYQYTYEIMQKRISQNNQN